MAIRYLAALWILTIFIAAFGFPDRFANVEASQVAHLDEVVSAKAR